MSYSLHESLMTITEDFMYAWENRDIGMVRRLIETDLATAYVMAKELETHGYEAFKALVAEYNQGEKE